MFFFRNNFDLPLHPKRAGEEEHLCYFRRSHAQRIHFTQRKGDRSASFAERRLRGAKSQTSNGPKRENAAHEGDDEEKHHWGYLGQHKDNDVDTHTGRVHLSS